MSLIKLEIYLLMGVVILLLVLLPIYILVGPSLGDASLPILKAAVDERDCKIAVVPGECCPKEVAINRLTAPVYEFLAYPRGIWGQDGENCQCEPRNYTLILEANACTLEEE